MLACALSASLAGIDATVVRVEVDVIHGLPIFTTVGLPDLAIRESRDRVRAALRNSGFDFPLARITVNLAPADRRKEGVSFDLPIALGLLAATGALDPSRLDGLLVAGELALDGGIHPVRGILPMALAAATAGLRGFLLPPANAREAAMVDGLAVQAVGTLAEAVSVLAGTAPPSPVAPADGRALLMAPPHEEVDFADVRGQSHAKRALEIAAAGGHHVLLLGPPGSGKTMLARRLPTILPPLTLAEAIDASRVWSVAGLLPAEGLVVGRPFRAPHHTISDAALVGGGRGPAPGEVSLAHRGVLFLDELPEFAPHVLDTLRQPLEEGQVAIARVAGRVTFPAAFQLVAALNPCRRACRTPDTCACAPTERARYLGRLSGPLLDRVDLHVQVPPVPYRDLAGGPEGESSRAIQRRVEAARARQRDRLGEGGGRPTVNARMTVREVASQCVVRPEGGRLLGQAVEQLGLSARAHERVLKVARTIADLAAQEAVEPEHVAEALQYRALDRRG